MKRIFTGPVHIKKEIGRMAKKGPERGIYSPAHALAKEISEYCNEPKKFAMYLGIVRNIGIRKAYQIFSKIKQSKDIKTPGKLFVYESAYKKSKKKPPPKRR